MFSLSLCIIITTTNLREKVLFWNIDHLLKHIRTPFSLFIYNDGSHSLKTNIDKIIENSKRKDIYLEILNDKGEINSTKVGCGGGRSLLFERVKDSYEVVVSLDDDMQITEGWYENIINAIIKFPNNSVFTCLIKGPNNNIQMAGSNIFIFEKRLYRYELGLTNEKYSITEWGPLGCLVLCREALKSKIIIPNLYVREDEAFYLEMKKYGINETIVVNEAIAIHRPIQTSDSNLRLPSKIKEAKQYFWDKYGIILK